MLAKFLICRSSIFTYSCHLGINQSHFWSLSVQSCFLLNYWQPVPWFDNCFNRWHCFKVARHDASHEMVRIVSFWMFNLAFMVMKWDFFCNTAEALGNEESKICGFVKARDTNLAQIWISHFVFPSHLSVFSFLYFFKRNTYRAKGWQS